MFRDDKNQDRNYVFYTGEDGDERFFEVPEKVFNKLRKKRKNISLANKLAVQNGLRAIDGDGGFTCSFCKHHDSHSGKNVMRIYFIHSFSGGFGIPGIDVEGCNYTKGKVRYSGIFQFKTGEVVEAWHTPCIVEDSKVESLVQSGELDKYGTVIKRIFPSIKSIIEEYVAERPELAERGNRGVT